MIVYLAAFDYGDLAHVGCFKEPLLTCMLCACVNPTMHLFSDFLKVFLAFTLPPFDFLGEQCMHVRFSKNKADNMLKGFIKSLLYLQGGRKNSKVG